MPDQSQLNPELVQSLKTRQSLLNVVKTTRTPGGQTLDWVPIESQHPEGKIAAPPPPAQTAVAEQDAEKPAKGVGFELDDPKAERGPTGTVPIARPDISVLTKKIAVQDYLSKRGSVMIKKKHPNKKPTPPDPFGYFHAMADQTAQSYGCDGYLNVWDPTVSGPGDDHSILQTWVQNYETAQLQSLEAGLTVDRALNGDTLPHLFTYYTTNSYSKDGNNLGGYNHLYSGWIQYNASVFPGIRINGTSTQGGPQFWVFIKYQLYQGNWWFGVQGSGSFIWIGYYPASLFGGSGLSNYTEWVDFGGEVYSSLANPCSTTDQMGSGRRAEDGWTHAAFERNLRLQSNTNGAMVNFNGLAETDSANKCSSDPYDIQLHMNSGTSWGSYFYVGGPAA